MHYRNPVMQARIGQLAEIAEAREDKTEPFRVMMVGDSTMEHQYGAMCSYLGEREGRRFDPEVCRIISYVRAHSDSKEGPFLF